MARDVRTSLDRTAPGRNVLLFLLPSSPPSPPVPSVDALPSSSAISLDKLLDAGLYTGEVTEIVGAPGSGKTQVHLRPAARRLGGGGCMVLGLWGSFCQHPVISELGREKLGGDERDLNSSLGAHSCLWDLDEIWWGGGLPFWALLEGSGSPNGLSLLRYVFVWQQMWPMACSRTSSTLIPMEGLQPPASSSCFRPGPRTRRSR